ncbi:MAG: alcohol dehydrogenase [Spirochaetaceae bacterium]|nr:alcohol dehydrogenase [Spirochaetaceae bacterium]|tara:strand:+ start:56820 stop:57854 length:1035 start_codon:yes stop_codon:yes gene_type:complete
MLAAVLEKGNPELIIRDVADPSLGEGQVRVAVEACGVCGSDLHITLHPIIRLKHYPRIPGHESAGHVLEVGPGVSDLKPGQRVVISAGTSCGHCPACKEGKENRCPEVGVLGFDRDGAFAEQIVVERSKVFPLPDSVPIEQGAILADAVSTPYHAIRFVGEMQPGQSVLIAGCGGLGIHGVMIAKALNAGRIIALDVDEGALANAERAGASEIYNAREMKRTMQKIRAKGDVDLMVDFSGVYSNAEYLIRGLRPGGKYVMVGLGKGALGFSMPPYMIYKELSIRGAYGSDSRSLPELIQLVESGRLNLAMSITSTHPLSEINQCLRKLDSREENPIRYIIQPGK